MPEDKKCPLLSDRGANRNCLKDECQWWVLCSNLDTLAVPEDKTPLYPRTVVHSDPENHWFKPEDEEPSSSKTTIYNNDVDEDYDGDYSSDNEAWNI